MADGLVIRITVENHTTGKKIVLNHDFQPGEVITIDIPKKERYKQYFGKYPK